MQLKEIKEILDKVVAVENQEEWDNSGLLVGDENKDINNCLIALELTRAVLDFAIEKNIDMIITHHPAIFTPLKSVIKEVGKENYIYDLITNNIALYSAHTNFDKLDDCMDSYIGRLLGGKSFENLENSHYGVTFEVHRATANYIAERLISLLKLESINSIGDINKEITKISVVTGSGSDMYKCAKESGAQLFITGDIKYHFAQDALNDDIVIFDIGHYGSEQIFSQVFIEKCSSVLAKLNLECYTGSQNPFKLILGR